MDHTDLCVLDEEIVKLYKKQQAENSYRRTLDGNSESVAYLPGSTVRFWLNDEPSEYALHWHPAVEMVIPLENSYTVIVGQDTYELSTGDIFIIPSGKLHHLIAPPTGRRLIFLFDFNLMSRIRGFSFLTYYLSQPVLINRDTCGPIYKEEFDIISQLSRDYFENDSLREMVIYSKLLAFFVNYVRFRKSLEGEASGAALDENRRKELADKFNVVFLYLDEHYAESLTLEKVADVAGFSKFHFSRLFKQYSGYNFYDYLCHKRINAAEALLLKPEISITEVALQSGFSSLSTFNRIFKKMRDCTPSEYRSLYNSQLHYPF